MANSNIYFRLGVCLILPALGVVTSILIKPSIDGAIAIINKWGEKEYEVLQNEDLQDFQVKRVYKNVRSSSHSLERRTDVIKKESLKFAKLISVVFIYGWLSLCILGIGVHLK